MMDFCLGGGEVRETMTVGANTWDLVKCERKEKKLKEKVTDDDNSGGFS